MSVGLRRRLRSSGSETAVDAAPSVRGTVLAVTAVTCWLLLAILIHLTQGTAQQIGLAELWQAITGGDHTQAGAVLSQSRLPRLIAAILVGAGFGAGGAALQAISRNPLASPETLGISAGAAPALAGFAAAKIVLPPLPGMAVAFIGGLAAGAAVIGLAGSRSLAPARLVLAGSALAMGLSALQQLLLLVFPWQTQGIVQWNAGSLAQNGVTAVTAVAPIMLAALIAILPFSRRLDLMQLGDDAATSYGVPVAGTRRSVLLAAIVLVAAGVVVSGPIGFVGLCAPASIRLLGRWLPGVRRSWVFILISALAGIALVLSADVLLRAVVGSQLGIMVPTGIVTSVIGAMFLIALAQRLHLGSVGESLATLGAGTRFGRAHPSWLLGAAAAILAAVLIAAMLLGDSDFLLGDLWQWITRTAPAGSTVILDLRLPRVLGAVLAGAALALAGMLVQTVTGNPLADPGILGVSSGAGLGAVIVLTGITGASGILVFGGAAMGAVAAVVLLLLLARTQQLRLVLVGVGISAGSGALIQLLLVRTDPYNQTKALTWLSGSTYGTTLAQLIPLCLSLLACLCLLIRNHRSLDLLQIDDTVAAVRGVSLGTGKLLAVLAAVALTTAATTAVGVIAFGGLLAPHIGRFLIGKRHALLAPLTAIIGAILLLAADLIGRTLLAPTQLPAGLVVALLGIPFFLWLLYRLRLDNR